MVMGMIWMVLVVTAVIAAALEGMQLVKELYVPGKLVNLVVRPR